MNKEIMNALKKQKQILESQGYTVAYICLHGSQNYGLDIYTDEYQSDIDIKAIIVPTLDDLVKNSKPISTKIDTEWGQCDIKDIRVYVETLLKANPSYIETLFTPYYLIDDRFKKEIFKIIYMREELVSALSAQFLRAIYGMMCEKEKAMCHPYPSIAHKIEKFGYDGKQVHHIQRMWLMMQDYFKYNKPLSKCFNPDESKIDFLIDLKLNKIPLEHAKTIASNTLEMAKNFKQDVLDSIDESKIDYSIKNKFLQLSQTIIKNKIIEECRRNKNV